MAVNIGKLNQPQLYNYEYDQLNRLVSMQAWRGFTSSTNSWSGMTATTDHQERITYDANGNIMSYFRNGNTSAGKPLDMDKLAYYYAVDGSGNKKNNQLLYVFDTVALATNYTEDIDRQSVGNYEYDSIGNLTRDNAEKISAITWNVYGKISQITKTASTVVGDLQLIRYGYDASGNRIRKTVYYNQDATNYRAAHTWYVRDASGNVMATYTSAGVMPKTSTRDTTSKVPLYLSELHMYGSSRLGIWSRNVNMDVLPTGGGTVALLGSAGIDTFNRGNKFFELSNHLGNVLVTVSDRKFGQSPVNNLYTSFTADVVSATDYAPFGMQMVGRSFDAAGSTAYRYGFNGKESDDEVKGEGNQQDYGMRIYDPRLGKFLSVDPLVNKYPELTPYQFASNMPIIAVDIDGEEGRIVTIYHSLSSGKEFFRTERADNVSYGSVTNRTITIHKYPVSTRNGIIWQQVGSPEVTFERMNGLPHSTNDGISSTSIDRPVIFQTGRIDLIDQTLGRLSEKYESRGPGTVSTGKGDHGGVSYGSWQLASNMGSPDDFLANEGSVYRREFGNSKPGTAEFSRIWKGIAQREPLAFKASQHAFIKRRDYDVMLSNVKEQIGIDINSRSQVLKDVVWSTAVQHGGQSNVIQKALAGRDLSKLDDATIIKLIYAERGRKNSSGQLARFYSSSIEVQQSVADRYKSEMKEALKKLGNQ
jgi:RHS repeat-associated protein